MRHHRLSRHRRLRRRIPRHFSSSSSSSCYENAKHTQTQKPQKQYEEKANHAKKKADTAQAKRTKTITVKR